MMNSSICSFVAAQIAINVNLLKIKNWQVKIKNQDRHHTHNIVIFKMISPINNKMK